jgi:hypothetical protein
MWNVDPTKMCRNHLLGEHLELHMFANALANNKPKLTGFVNKGLLHMENIVLRHKILAEEMKNRNYNHKSPLEMPKALPDYVTVELWTTNLIDIEKNERDLHSRCSKCKF